MAEEELSVKEFAEKQGLGEMQVRRILEDPKRYPPERYGIEYAHKIGRRWKIKLKSVSVTVTAPGAAELVNRVGLALSSLEERYPLKQVISDLQTQPLDQVLNKAVQRLPPPGEVAKRMGEAVKGGPPPDQVLFKIKQFFQ